jgi:hypothetical protein
MEKIQESALEAKAALLEFWDDLNVGVGIEQELARATAEAIEKLRQQADAQKGIADAQKELELAALKRSKESGAIGQSGYDLRKGEIEGAAERRRVDQEKKEREAVLQEHWKEVARAEAAQKEAAAKIPQLAEAAQAAKEQADANAERLARARANEAKTKAAPGLTMDELNVAIVNHGVIEAAAKAQPEFLAAAKAAQAELARAESEAKNLKRAAEAKTAAATAEAHGADIKNAAGEEIYKKHQQTRGMQGPYGEAAAGDLTQAEATAQALKKGMPVSKSAADEMVAVAQAIGGHSFTVKQAADALSQISRHSGAFAADVLRLVSVMEAMTPSLSSAHSRISVLEQQVKDIRAQARNAQAPGGQ